MEHRMFAKGPISDTTIWKNCIEWMSPIAPSAEVGPSSAPESQITK